MSGGWIRKDWTGISSDIRRAVGGLIMLACATTSVSRAQQADATHQLPLPGPREITFKNGRTFVGEVVAVEGTRVRLAPYDGSAFGMDWSAVKSSRPLTEVEQLRGKAGALEAKGNVTGAMKLLEPHVKNHPGLSGDIDRLMGRMHDERSAMRDERLKNYRVRFDEAMDRRQLETARDLVQAELTRLPDDVELLEDSLTVEFLMHRAAGGKPAEFKSSGLERLRKLAPESAVLDGVAAEIGRGETLQKNFDQVRRRTIETALARAQELHKQYQIGEARGVLEEALGLNPDPAEARPMRELLTRINGELAAQKADERERQLKRLAEWKAKNPAVTAGVSRGLDDKDFDRMKEKRLKRAAQSARNGKGRDLTPKGR